MNYSNQRIGVKYFLDDFGGAVRPPDSLLFPARYSSTNAIFLMVISGVGEYGQGKQGTNEQRQINLVDNLSLIKSSHQLKFGVDYRWLSPFSSPYSYEQFALFSGVAGVPGGALSGTASFAQAIGFSASALLSKHFGFYGQDTWKMTPQLTVTYGLRWDVNPPIEGKEFSQRSLHGSWVEQSRDDDFGASRHSAPPDNL